MSTKASVKLVAICLCLSLLLFGVLIRDSLVSYQRSVNKQTVAIQIADEIFQRRLVADDYLLDHTDRAKAQWSIKQTDIAGLVRDHMAKFNEPRQKMLFEQIETGLRDSAETFTELVQAYESSKFSPAVLVEKQSRFASELSVRAQSTITAATKLQTLNQQAANTALHKGVASASILGSIFLILLAGGFIVVWRSTNRLERKEFEESAILSSIGDGVFAIDSSGKILLFNQAAESLTGRPRNQTLGAPYQQMLTFKDEKDGALVDNFIKLALSGKQAPMPDHTVLQRQDGSLLPVADSAAPIIDARGAVVGAVVVFRDVTEERALQRSKDELISLASHQLKTPPTALKWDLELLLNGDLGKLNDQQRNLLVRMSATTNGMVDVVNALLNVSRIDLGAFIIKPEPVDFIEVAKEVVEELAKLATDKKITIAQHYPTVLPSVSADPGLAKIIVENLVSNAIKYSPAGGKVNITLESSAQHVKLTVSDTGYGIPKAQQAKIFSKMFRADNIKDKAEGTGLGLYLLKTVVEQVARGRIWFESAEGRGTTFYVELPLTGMAAKKGTSRLV